MAAPARAHVVHDDSLGLDFGPDHPVDARRHRLAMALAREAGLLDLAGVTHEPGPPGMTDEQLHRTFAPAFVRAIRRYSADPVLASEMEARQWGIDGDNGAYAGMHEQAARLAAASAAGARAVGEGRALRAFVPTGGTHHGLANRVWGFGIYNDTAVAINALRDAGLSRVAYVDLDVHHGNGTQWIFYSEPEVLTVSVHESGRHLFPGSGFAAETGAPGAEGASANVALPPFAGDDAYRRAFSEVVAPLVRAFRPDAIVSQCGVDSHHADPLAHLLTTIGLFPWLWRGLRELADQVCEGRWVALGGGGYEPCSVPPRAWAMLLAEQAGAPVTGGPLPEAWRRQALAVGCPEPALGWLDDAGPAPDPERDARAAAGADRAIAEARAALSRYWALAPAA